MNNGEVTEATMDLDLQLEDDAWKEIVNLLTAGKYASAARLLEETESVTQNGHDPAVQTVLETARQICLAGKDFRAAVDYHKNAYKMASERERQLRGQLQSLLCLILSRANAPALPDVSGETTLKPLQNAADPTRDVPRLLKRLQQLLGRGAEEPLPLQTADGALARLEKTGAAGARPGPSLAVYCLGSFAVYQNDRLITDWNGLKGLKILKVLIAQRGKPVSKDVLMEVLWPESDPESARRNLHQAIYSLRQTLREDAPDFQHILFQNDAYSFNPQITLWLDVEHFERYATLGQKHEAAGREDEAIAAYAIAEELYQGDFLEEDPYEDWAQADRARLRGLYMTVAERLADFYLQREEYVAVIGIAQRALARDPYFEAAHRQLMQCFAAQGQRHLAVRQFQTCSRLLAQELELEPSPQLTTLYEAIKQAS